MSYLMDVLDEKLPQAAATANIRIGVTAMMEIVGAFLGDAYIGRYQTILYATIINVTGLSLLAVSASNLILKTRAFTGSEQIAMFRVGLFLVALGKAGLAPTLKIFVADQLTSSSEELEDKQAKTRINFWWFTGVNLGAAAGIVLLAFVEGRQEWLMGYAVLALTMFVTLLVFIYGKSVYNCKVPCGSVLARASHVFVAAMFKRHLKCPPDACQLYRGDCSQLPQTTSLRFLDKAAIIESLSLSQDLEEQRNNWRLCSVTEVEETKLLLRMFPMWTTFLIYGLVRSLGSTFFLQQGSNMNRNLGSIRLPLPFLLIFSKFSSVQIGWHCKQFSKKLKFTSTRRIGIGMFFSVLCCCTASLVEIRRLGVVTQHGLLDKPKDTVPMSVFWLGPQFLLLGTMDGFVYFGIKNFFLGQVPESMRNFVPSFCASVIGTGSLLSVAVIAASDKSSRQGGQPGWLADTVNRSHLDYFFWILTILSCINLCFYGLVSSIYSYKKSSEEAELNGHFADISL
ncbi:protein NRT1/ PTR FAMILY 5.4-like isoform X1 [Macadamia integrifolia]|uniref:protein NRT1/ PTR FAMILY 5.4-like isoform X1 n=1 Tax=Macadamia integrifolia TaxID=60698 RepID=UPI001C4EA02F|nr:protein NRT1/ PTR FAMILY 5.4-like isoform X1 [Macadamia integrifolia]XP_042487461.1 protein NRT1/ PTR FAMILY 5.4-like isoform X1 [Macadamia integrifolia]XP_042487462.1 protein NRT1/ PTR FAMILY 5.4-like isoform X1 [Macadamia integrifolia]XP_042487463.1 protein NRT1/ PTR FAMILY 5.4-like isoform X1 [Macadamia integrifolia]